MSDKLTPKQEAFVLAYLKTGNASEAYRQAYDAEAMADNVIHVKACELLKNGKVAVRLAGLHSKAEVKALLSLEDHMDELRQLRDLAKTEKQISAAISAEVKRGELRKFYVKQIETGLPGEFEQMSDDELREFVARRAAEACESDAGTRKTRGSRKAGEQLN